MVLEGLLAKKGVVADDGSGSTPGLVAGAAGFEGLAVDEFIKPPISADGIEAVGLMGGEEIVMGKICLALVGQVGDIKAIE